MPRVVEYVTTPNPHALKCVLDAPLPALSDHDKVRSYRDAASAASDPLAARLFAIEGVRNVLIVGNWVTVSKADAAAWKSIKAGVEKVFASVDVG
jgi:hypothetical protein